MRRILLVLTFMSFAAWSQPAHLQGFDIGHEDTISFP